MPARPQIIHSIGWSSPAECHRDSCYGVEVVSIPREGKAPFHDVGLLVHVQLSRALGESEQLSVGRPWAVTNPLGTGWDTAKHGPLGPESPKLGDDNDRRSCTFSKSGAVAAAGMRSFVTYAQSVASDSKSHPAAVCYEFEVHARAGDWLVVTVVSSAPQSSQVGLPASERLIIFEWCQAAVVAASLGPLPSGTAGLPGEPPEARSARGSVGGCGVRCNCFKQTSFTPVKPRHAGGGCHPCGALVDAAATALGYSEQVEPGAAQEQLASRARKELGSLEDMVRRLGLQASEALSGQTVDEGWEEGLREAFDAEIATVLNEVSDVAEEASTQAVQSLAAALGGAAAKGARAGRVAAEEAGMGAKHALPLVNRVQAGLKELGVLLGGIVDTLETFSAGELPAAVSPDRAYAAAAARAAAAADAALPDLSVGPEEVAAVSEGVATDARELFSAMALWARDFDAQLLALTESISTLAEEAEDRLEEAVERAARTLRAALVTKLHARLTDAVSGALDGVLSGARQSEAGKIFASALRVSKSIMGEPGSAGGGVGEILKGMISREVERLVNGVAQRVFRTSVAARTSVGGGVAVALSLRSRLLGLASGARSA